MKTQEHTVMSRAGSSLKVGMFTLAAAALLTALAARGEESAAMAAAARSSRSSKARSFSLTKATPSRGVLKVQGTRMAVVSGESTNRIMENLSFNAQIGVWNLRGDGRDGQLEQQLADRLGRQKRSVLRHGEKSLPFKPIVY